MLFGWASGYKINEQKSILMDLGLMEKERGHISKHFQAKLNDEKVCYLGVRICASVSPLYLLDSNITPFVNWMQSQFEKWSLLRLSWAVCIVVMKMKVLLKWLGFYSQSYYLYFRPHHFLNRIQSISHRYLE